MNENWKKITSTFEVAIPTLDGKKVAYTVPVEVVCEIEPHSGVKVLTPESLELIEKTKARHMGLLAPEDIQQLRERLRLTQKEITELLLLGGKTWSRWETGRERPSRSMNILLRALWDGKLDIPYLERMALPCDHRMNRLIMPQDTISRYRARCIDNPEEKTSPADEEYSIAA